jgi:hypothetical protein
MSFPNNVGGRSDLRSLAHRFYSYVLYTSPCPLSPAVNTSHLRHPPIAFQIRRLHRSWSASLLPTLNISQDSSLIHKDLPILPLLPHPCLLTPRNDLVEDVVGVDREAEKVWHDAAEEYQRQF